MENKYAYRHDENCIKMPGYSCEDRVGTGPPQARTEVIYVDLGYWAISVVFIIPGTCWDLQTRRESKRAEGHQSPATIQ